MLFSSPEFVLLFLPLTVMGYFALRGTAFPFAAKYWLICASLFFYGYWTPAYLALLLGSVGVNFFLGRALHRQTGQDETDISIHQRRRKRVLFAGVAFNLLLLGYFKYVNFFMENVGTLVGSEFPLPDIVLPLAISFFTFQQIAYLVDCYQTDTQTYDFVDYTLFVTFFPQLIAGPIVHHREMMPQFAGRGSGAMHWDHLALGVFVFSLGLFKKLIIADGFAVWADAGFESVLQPTLFEAWIASLSYTFQLYFDFSGYCDMATGAALMFNIRLPVNFNSPYKAQNIQDFWRRWHITLSNWLRDYLYIPLGGNRSGPGRTAVNLTITFLLGGLWHGAGWTFLCWGALHGVALTLHRSWQMLGMRVRPFWGWLFTFLFVNWAWVMFRASSIQDAVSIWKGMLGMNGVALTPWFAGKVSEWFGAGVTDGLVTGRDLAAIISNDSVLAILFCTLFCALSPNVLQLAGLVAYDGRLAFRTTRTLALANGLLTGYCILYMVTTRSEVFLYFNF